MTKKRKKDKRAFSREAFDAIMHLLSEREWLSNRAIAFSELMHEFCSNEQETDLLCDLLRRHIHLRQDEFATHLESIPNQIVNEWKLPEDETQVVATTTDRSPDSGQLVIQSLKPLFVQCGWTKPKLANRQTAVLELIEQRPNVVIVDDFSGTGNTIVNVIQDIRRRCDQKGVAHPRSVYVCLVAAMEAAVATIESEGATVFAPIKLKKGINDYFAGQDLTDSIACMLELESRLAPKVHNRKLPSFGWGQAEALFSIDRQNTPNSVFPVFWWPETIDKRNRYTLLVRMI